MYEGVPQDESKETDSLFSESGSSTSSSHGIPPLDRINGEVTDDESEERKLVRDDDSLSPVTPVSSLDEVIWSVEEEKRLVRKIDSLVIPLLIVAFFALQLDRGNIGNALTDYFLKDVGISQSQFNTGQQLLSLGIVIWEIPSNIVLYRIGPSLWLSGQIFAWGFVATVQAFQHGFGAWLITRFLLGSCESGFIPAGFYTITRWYKKDETSKRFAIFFLGNMIMQALGGDIAYAILHLRGVAGLAGWQWLFIIEGLITMSVGIVFMITFPRSPSHPVSLTGIRWFTERESHILVQRVIQDDPTKHETSKHVSRAELKRTLTNWRLLPHVLLTILGLSPTSTLLAYGPSMVIGWGYERLAANAWASIGPWCMVFLNVIWGFWADRISMRGPIVLLGAFFWWLSCLSSRLAVQSRSNETRFGLYIMAYMFSQIWHPLNGSWMSLNAGSSAERSVTMAILIMSANTAGFIGSQFFQENDAPRYRGGWTIITVMVSIALLCAIWANLQYWILNRRLEKKGSLQRWHQ